MYIFFYVSVYVCMCIKSVMHLLTAVVYYIILHHITLCCLVLHNALHYLTLHTHIVYFELQITSYVFGQWHLRWFPRESRGGAP